MDFTQPARKYGEAGIGLMLVPAWDFGMDRWWHGHIAVMRGVESGFSVARSAKGGYLTVSDSRGRILAQTRSDSAPFATLTADVPVAHSGTLYLVLGDWFAWVALAVLCFAIVQLYRLRRRRKGPDGKLSHYAASHGFTTGMPHGSKSLTLRFAAFQVEFEPE
jgi:apolipoprotein N-acyltransferase